jgi:hypothetical protein
MECLAVSFALDLGCFDDWQLGIKYQVQRLKKSVDAPCFSSAF